MTVSTAIISVNAEDTVYSEPEQTVYEAEADGTGTDNIEPADEPADAAEPDGADMPVVLADANGLTIEGLPLSALIYRLICEPVVYFLKII